MEAAASRGYTLATDVADYLVGKGVAFRDAHGVVAELVKFAQSDRRLLTDLTLEEYRRFSPMFDEDVLAIDVPWSIAARDVPGGTAPGRVAAALRDARARLDK
jgi:argininosuccinate lyase